MNEYKIQVEKRDDALQEKMNSVLRTISLAKEAYEQGRVKRFDHPQGLPFLTASLQSA